MVKHNKLCRTLEERCNKRNNIDSFINIEYGNRKKNVIGEVDVWQIYDKYEVYFEVKCRNHYKNEHKALQQTIRWSKHMKQTEPNKDYYGVYYTPTYVKILCKNGNVR